MGEAACELDKAKSEQVTAERGYQRQKLLLEAKATSVYEVEQAEAAYRKAAAEVKRVEQKMLLLQGKQRARNYTLRASMDGEVIEKNVTLGQEVQGLYTAADAAALFVLGDVRRVWLLMDLYEPYGRSVKVGAAIEAWILSFPQRRFEAKVEWIGDQVDPATHAVHARATIENQDRLLKVEMYARVKIVVSRRRALALPCTAVFKQGGATVAFTQIGCSTKGQVRFRRVPLHGQSSADYGWIAVEGLRRGTLFVASGGILLTGRREG